MFNTVPSCGRDTFAYVRVAPTPGWGQMEAIKAGVRVVRAPPPHRRRPAPNATAPPTFAGPRGQAEGFGGVFLVE